MRYNFSTMAPMDEFFSKVKIKNPFAKPEVPELSVEDLKRRLDEGQKVFILDVREPGEYEICRLPGSKLIPLANLVDRWQELDPSNEIVVHCKAGGRSARAVKFLQGKGFSKVFNLSGGVDSWADKIDPSMPRY